MSARRLLLATGLVLALGAGAPTAAQECTLAASLVNSGVGKDAIPPLLNPQVLDVPAAALEWSNDTRVLGVVIDGQARAYPMPILWWHEIVNDQLGGKPILVSYCPLTGTGLVFDPVVDGEFVTFGTSGLIYENNLVMYSRGKEESLWPQLDETALCESPAEGQTLPLYPATETTWLAWKQLYPETTIVSRGTGHQRDYDTYPYGDYDAVDNTLLLYPQSFVDPRLPMKALVYGVRHEGSAIAYSHAGLAELGDRAVVNGTLNGLRTAVVWDAASLTVRGFDRRPRIWKKGRWKSKTLKLELVPGDDGSSFVLRHKRSKTTFSLTGEVIAGKLADRIENGRLEPLTNAYTAFWFAWATFHRGTEVR